MAGSLEVLVLREVLVDEESSGADGLVAADGGLLP
jgi:hypothetical protein